MIIGITGSSGSGKSTVCEILQKKYGVLVINADKIARQLSKKGTYYLADIIEQFGTDILLENGELNRKKLAEIIYTNPEKRELLNRCTFKHIREEIELEIRKVETIWKEKRNVKTNSIETVKNMEKISEYEDVSDVVKNATYISEPIIAIDAPLLFEAKLESLCQFVIAVVSDNRELQVQRIIQRDGITKEQAVARLNAQKLNEFYTIRSKYVIVNNGELKKVERQIEKILKNEKSGM